MDLRKDMADLGAVLEGKFFFALKKQGSVSCTYINIDPIFTDSQFVSTLGRELVAPPYDQNCSFNAFVAPAIGGIPLLYAAAAAHNMDCTVAWADKKPDGTFAFERMGFAKAIEGRQVVVLEDIVSSGGSLKSVADLVHKVGGEVVAGSIIWNRGNIAAKDAGVPKLYSLIIEQIEVWEAGQHPNWGEWPLIEDIGHPEYFHDYPGPRMRLLKTK